MTREDIARIAGEAGFRNCSDGWFDAGFHEEKFERFAALVIAASKPEVAIAEAYRCGYESGAIAARDACIALCTQHWQCGGNAMECADAIRARAEK